VAELAQPPRVFAVMPGGQAGHPSSPHYDDQLADWLAGRLHPLAAAPEEVAGPALRLVPLAAR
jgi:acyl-homoserine lactone acylase PvdQ